jgi:hypothetical protein
MIGLISFNSFILITMKVLVACEESQVVCSAFRAKGHEAYSCDIVPCSGGHPEWHIQDDVLKHLNDGWDLMIAHPPCMYLSNVGAQWFKKDPTRYEKRDEAAAFFMNLVDAPIPKICIENPVGYMNIFYRKADQIIHPFYFGDNDKKRTCLWFKGLPELSWNKHLGFFDSRKEPQPLYICQGKKCQGRKIYRTEGIKGCGNKEARARARAKTFPGIAAAMADQWG